MSQPAHIWAIGYDDAGRAEEARREIASLGGAGQSVELLDIALLVRRADGSCGLDRKPFPRTGNMLVGGILDFLVGAAMAVSLSGAAVETFLGGAGSDVPGDAGIDEKFISDVKAMMKPGSYAVLVLDNARNVEEGLRAIGGLGGTVLRTNVDLERLKLVQSALNSKPGDGTKK